MDTMREKPNLLYIDDEEDILTSFKYHFMDDFNIYTAVSAKEGLEILKNNQIEIIISDQRMPEQSGTEFFADIISEYPEAIRFILTGYSDIHAVIEAINKGKVYHYLQKPLDEVELKMVIYNALEATKLQRERTKLIEKLEKLNAELLRQADNLKKEIEIRKLRESELVIAKEEALKSDRLKTEFLSQISHEIRTPLNTIHSFSELITKELSDNFSSEVLDCISAIEISSKRIIRTVEMIINMASIQTGAYDLKIKKMNLVNDVIIPEMELYKSIIESKKLDLVFNEPESDFIVEADQYSISQIFVNILDNAVKFTESGKIEIIVKDSGDMIDIEISDTGIGISTEYSPNLFKPFTQEESGYSRSYDGIGLGLALVKSFCDLNGHKITISSKKNSGTKVIISLEK